MHCFIFRPEHTSTNYPSDLSDAQWNLIRDLLPVNKPLGRDLETSLRDVVNAIFYVNRSGCAWRMLPSDFPSKSTVFRYYSLWRKDGTWDRIHDRLRALKKVFETAVNENNLELLRPHLDEQFSVVTYTDSA